MKCNKCGTPIITGENTCRICGNQADFSERIKEPEIIDFLDEEENVTEAETALPDLYDLVDVDVNQPNVDNNNEEGQQVIELVIEPEVQEMIQEETIEQPLDFEQTMSLDPTETELNPELVSESVVNLEAINEVAEEPKETVEDNKRNKKKVLEKANEKEEKTKKAPKVKKEKKSSNNLGVILLTIVLLCSLGLNAYLFIMDGNAKAGNGNEATEGKQAYSKVSYSNYKITMPSTWVTENSNTSLLIYDDTQNWSASLQVIEDVDYNTFITNRENLVETLGNLKYQFTSNYSKEVGEKDFHLFKGKYYEYSVFVIVTELDDSSVLAVDLKFKGEVDDVLLNNILKSMAEVKENDTAGLFKDNFEFKDISNEIKLVSQKTEE